MIKTVKLTTDVNTPDMNGVVYSEDIMKKIVLYLNKLRFIPIVVNLNPDEYNNPPVGRVIPKTAFFDGKKISVDIDIEEHLVSMIDSGMYVVSSYITAELDENNNVIYSSIFNVNEIQIIRNLKKEENK